MTSTARPFAECSPSALKTLLCPRKAQELWHRGLQDDSTEQAVLGTLVHELAARYIALCSRKRKRKLRWWSFQSLMERVWSEFVKEHPEHDNPHFEGNYLAQASDLHRNLSLPVSKPSDEWRHIVEERIIFSWPGMERIDPAELHNKAGRIQLDRLKCDVLSGKPDLLSLKKVDGVWAKGYLSDLKSGRAVQQFKAVRLNEQIRFYCYLAFLAYPQLAEIDAGIYGMSVKNDKKYVTYKRESPCKFDGEDCTLMEWGERTAHRFFGLLDALWTALGTDDYPTQAGPHCEYCPLSKGLVCPELRRDLIELEILEVAA